MWLMMRQNPYVWLIIKCLLSRASNRVVSESYSWKIWHVFCCVFWLRRVEGDNVLFTNVSRFGSDNKYLWLSFYHEPLVNVSQRVCPLLRDATCLALTYTDIGVFSSICTLFGVLFLTSSQVYVGKHKRRGVMWLGLIHTWVIKKIK